jgi:hypothetical protein
MSTAPVQARLPRERLTGQALAAQMHSRSAEGVRVSPPRRERLAELLSSGAYLERHDWHDLARALAEDLRSTRLAGQDIHTLRRVWGEVKAAFFEGQGDSAEALALMEMDSLLGVHDDGSVASPAPIDAPTDSRLPFDWDALARAYREALSHDANGRQPANDAPMDVWFAYVLNLGFRAAMARHRELVREVEALVTALDYLGERKRVLPAHVVEPRDRVRALLAIITGSEGRTQSDRLAVAGFAPVPDKGAHRSPGGVETVRAAHERAVADVVEQARRVDACLFGWADTEGHHAEQGCLTALNAAMDRLNAVQAAQQGSARRGGDEVTR